MSLHCKKYNYIFIHNPKCAGTTMSFLLERLGPCGGAGSGHKSIQEYKNEGINIDSMFKWGFVRNPYDRVLSAYAYNMWQIGETFDKTFKQFVLNIQEDMEIGQFRQHVRQQYKYLCIDGNMSLDFIGRYENISNDWQYVCDKIFQQASNIDDVHNSSRRHYPRVGTPAQLRDFKNDIKNYHHIEHPYLKFFDSETIKKVNEVYTKDFELFGYEMEKQ